jgi:hypothetical protein
MDKLSTFFLKVPGGVACEVLCTCCKVCRAFWRPHREAREGGTKTRVLCRVQARGAGSPLMAPADRSIAHSRSASFEWIFLFLIFIKCNISAR